MQLFISKTLEVKGSLRHQTTTKVIIQKIDHNSFSQGCNTIKQQTTLEDCMIISYEVKYSLIIQISN